jgi:hypothetical protein
MSVLNENQLLGSSGAGGAYNLTDSLRFRESASAYLERTPAVAGNLKTWTWSGWVKRGNVAASTYYCLFGVDGVTPTNRTEITFSANAIFIYEQVTTATISLTTTGLFRDPSAWYHIVVAIDTTQATSTNRVKLYVNGEQITSFSSATYPSLNYNTFVNSTNTHVTGARRYSNGTINKHFDGYLTEINLIDGQALTPSDFGEYNEDTGVWQPIEYTGTYGTNGFYLPMNQTVETYDATYLVVAGGGSGGGGWTGGGGGAGGLLTGTATLIPSSIYTVTVGAGGTGSGTNGANSVFNSLTAIGGGGGATDNSATPGNTGGSGGGNGYNVTTPPTNNTAGQGNSGGRGSGWDGGASTVTGGGGGGAGGAGSAGVLSNAGDGGIGTTSSITGTSTYYAGGGGGGGASGSSSPGGTGGGGAGGVGASVAGVAGTANTGGGGGGYGRNAGTGASGGSGVVILRVPTAKYTGTTTGSPTVTTDGSDTVVKFTASGSYTA